MSPLATTYYEFEMPKISSDLKAIFSDPDPNKKVRVIVSLKRDSNLEEMISVLRDTNIEVLENESFDGLAPEVICLINQMELQALEKMDQVTSIERDGKMFIQS
jgi:hypothetical protein